METKHEVFVGGCKDGWLIPVDKNAAMVNVPMPALRAIAGPPPPGADTTIRQQLYCRIVVAFDDTGETLDFFAVDGMSAREALGRVIAKYGE